MPTALMEGIRRQKDADRKATVLHAMRGEVKQAFEQISKIAEHKDIAHNVANEWISRPPEDQEETGVVVLTNAMRRRANDYIRADLER